MSTIINNNAITKMYKGDTPIYSFSINSGGGTPTKIDVAATGIRLAYSTFTEIPDIFDFSNITNMNNLFANCSLLTTIPADLDFSNVVDLGSTFNGCSSLSITPDELVTPNVNKMDWLFFNCNNLTKIPLLDCTSLTNATFIFGLSQNTAKTFIGGLKNLKLSITSNFLNLFPNLTVQSLNNVINYLWDWSGNTDGYAPLNNGTLYNFGTTHLLIFGQTNLDKLTAEQIAVATAKGWTLTA